MTNRIQIRLRIVVRLRNLIRSLRRGETGIFASTAINAAGPNGLLYGNPAQVVSQLIGIVVVAVFAFVGSYVLLRVINVFVPIRVRSKDKDAGLDISQHGEEAYADGH